MKDENMKKNQIIRELRKRTIELEQELIEHKQQEVDLKKFAERYRLISETTNALISTSTFSLNPLYPY